MATAALFFWVWMEATAVVGPAYPPDAVFGGTVVAVLHVSGGAVAKISIQQGDAPFADAVRAALVRWRFSRGENSDTLVVVNFRNPALNSAGPASRNMDDRYAFPGLAYPRKVTDPAYPPNSLAEGSVVLRLELSAAGTVSNVKTIQGLGNLTAPSISAVRSWQFAPARNKKAPASKGYVYAVCVFRRPVLSPHPGN